MSVLIDTNVLLRRTQPGHASHTAAVESVAALLSTGEPVCFTLQNIAEFWNIVTRPMASNGLGFSPDAAAEGVAKIERVLTLLPDTAAVCGEWKRLVVRYAVLGSKVHDARLVATMNVHGVDRILTFNVADFSRYGIEVLFPPSLLP